MIQSSSIWQSPEVIAAVVGALLAGILTALGFYVRSKRSNRIVVTRLSQSPQIDVSRRVRRNLRVLYNDKPVRSLVLNILHIHNDGVELIRDIRLKLHAEASTPVPGGPELEEFLDVEHQDPIDERKEETHVDIIPGSATPESKAAWTVEIEIPYLNPRKSYKEEQLELAIFSAGEINLSVAGGGAGWFSKYRDIRRRPRPDQYFAMLLLGTSALLLLVASTIFAEIGQARVYESPLLSFGLRVLVEGSLLGFGVGTALAVAFAIVRLVRFLRNLISARRKAG